MRIKIIGEIYEVEHKGTDGYLDDDYLLGRLQGMLDVISYTDCYGDLNDKECRDEIIKLIEYSLPKGYEVNKFDENHIAIEF